MRHLWNCFSDYKKEENQNKYFSQPVLNIKKITPFSAVLIKKLDTASLAHKRDSNLYILIYLSNRFLEFNIEFYSVAMIHKTCRNKISRTFNSRRIQMASWNIVVGFAFSICECRKMGLRLEKIELTAGKSLCYCAYSSSFSLLLYLFKRI